MEPMKKQDAPRPNEDEQQAAQRRPGEGLGEWLLRLNRDFGVTRVEYLRAPDRPRK